MSILITNDDGYTSPGLRVLHDVALEVFGKDIIVVVPDRLQSSSGMSFTFHKPLRVDKTHYDGMQCFIVSGTPADCVLLALKHIVKKKIDLVLSGINLGMNAGLETLYSSGTISAAIFAAISGVQSIALSKHVKEDTPFSNSSNEIGQIKSRLRFILGRVKDRGLPPGVDILNINFPLKTTSKTRIKAARTDKGVFIERVLKKKDPRGRGYYWLYGDMRKNLDSNADLATLLRGDIAVTPVSLASIDEEGLSNTEKLFG